jgi:hydroxymethylbilane synthase
MRIDDPEIYELIKPLNDEISQQCVTAERAFSRRLFGGCQLPIAAYATITDKQLTMQGLVGRIDGSEIIRDVISGAPDEGEQLGKQLAELLLANGADIILHEIINA